MSLFSLVGLMAQRFGPEWDALTPKQRKLVLDDFVEMLREDYDTPDPTMDDFMAQENAEDASRKYRRNIGGGNLLSYVKCLEVNASRSK